MENIKITNIDEYIYQFSENIQEILQKVREIIKKAAPETEETISYQMPTFKLNGNLVHFAANKNHLGFYPTPSAIIKFEEELKPYKTSKGAIQFPFNKEIPYDLIEQITEFTVIENKFKTKIK